MQGSPNVNNLLDMMENISEDENFEFYDRNCFYAEKPSANPNEHASKMNDIFYKSE